MKKIDNVLLDDELAEVYEEISDEERDFYAYIDDVSNQIFELMESQGVNRAELARRLGVTKPFVTKVLAGDANLQAKTFIKILCALDARAEVKIVRKNARTQCLGAAPTRRSHRDILPATPPS